MPGQKTYAEKLMDPRWQRKRLEVLQRDDFTCQGCYSKETTLHVHHRHYERDKDPWDYDLDDLTTVCADCHWKLKQFKTDILHALRCVDVAILVNASDGPARSAYSFLAAFMEELFQTVDLTFGCGLYDRPKGAS